jgi:hypothetical protein
MNMDAFDSMPPAEVQRHLANLRRNHAKAKQQHGRNGHEERRSRGGFVKVPTAWATRLANVNHASTFKLALHLLHQHWRTGGKDIPLSNVMLATSGLVSRETKRRALKELEGLGLVTVTRCRRRAPRVRIAVN